MYSTIGHHHHNHMPLHKYNITNIMLLHCCYTTVYSVTTQIEKIIKMFWYQQSFSVSQKTLLHLLSMWFDRTCGDRYQKFKVCLSINIFLVFLPGVFFFHKWSFNSIHVTLFWQRLWAARKVDKSISLGHTHPQFFAETFCIVW